MTDRHISLDATIALDELDGSDFEAVRAHSATLRKALSALPAVGGWLDIDTFAEPTSLTSGDGVLIACINGDVGEAYYRNFGDDSDGWWWSNTSWGDYPEPDRPTPVKWQPLPAPPEIE